MVVIYGKKIFKCLPEGREPVRCAARHFLLALPTAYDVTFLAGGALRAFLCASPIATVGTSLIILAAVLAFSPADALGFSLRVASAFVVAPSDSSWHLCIT